MTLRSRTVRRAGLAIAAGVFGVALVAVPAAAHDELVGSDPADEAILDTAPTEVALEFDQPVQTGFGLVAVLDATGAHHELGEPVVVGSTVTQALHPLDAGAYEISYRVGSADGHPITGTLTFTVAGTGTAPESTPQVSAGTAAPTPSSSDPNEGVDHDDHATPSTEPVDAADADSGGTSPLLLGAGGVAAAAVLAAVVFYAMGGRRPREAEGGDATETGP